MPRLYRLLGAAALCCVLMSVAAACASKGAPAASTTGGDRPLVAMDDFYLRPGQQFSVWFHADAGELRVIVMASTPPIKCVLKLTEADGVSRAKVIPMSGERGRPEGTFTKYGLDTGTPLKPGWYRLSLSGQGEIMYLGAGQV